MGSLSRRCFYNNFIVSRNLKGVTRSLLVVPSVEGGRKEKIKMLKKGMRLLQMNKNEAFVLQKDLKVGIKTFRGVICQENSTTVISPETIERELRIFLLKKELFLMWIESTPESGEFERFKGDLLLVWLEEGRKATNCLIVHSCGEYMAGLASYITKIDDSENKLNYIKDFFQAGAKVIDAELAYRGIDAALPVCEQIIALPDEVLQDETEQ